MRNLLGGKGANLAEMANLGLPVPPGFTITTEVCTEFYEQRQRYPAWLERRGRAPRSPAIGAAGRADFGDAERSAARVGPLRRPRVDAGHDGHRAQSRPQRRNRRGRWRSALGRPPLRL